MIDNGLFQPIKAFNKTRSQLAISDLICYLQAFIQPYLLIIVALATQERFGSQCEF